MSFLSNPGGTVKQSMTFQERPKTPPEIRKYRRSANLEPGARFKHFGTADDYAKMNLGDLTFGEKSESIRTTAHDLLSHHKLSDFEKLELMKAEKVYKDAAKNRLGKSTSYNYNDNFKAMEGRAFGIKSVSSLEPAKGIIFPEVSEESVAGEEIYKKSHGACAPGEQKRRGYNYPGGPEYPNVTRFGVKGDTIALNGVSKNITDVLKSVDERAPMVNTKNVEDYREMQDTLGKSKNLGQGSANRPIDYAYGKPSGAQLRAAKGKAPIGADEVLRGNYSLEDQLPDKDLGKTITPGFRNITLETRAFGLPCVRTDIPAPPINSRSCANNQNYGDEATASELINPQPFADMRISEKSMFENRSKAALFTFFEKIGSSADTDVMEICFKLASRDGDGATIQDFRGYLNEYFDACDTGDEMQWRTYYGI